MGQRGPAPEPLALRVLKGETRPSQLNKAPQPQDPPAKPADLDARASAVWDAVMAATASTSHIGPQHAETFRQYCEATAVLNGYNPKGTKEWRDLATLHRQLARELCLTPATGAGLRATKREARAIDKYVTRTG